MRLHDAFVRLRPCSLLPLLFLHLHLVLPVAAAASTHEPLKPCTARAPSGTFYDLNLMAAALPDHDGELKAGERNTSWPARGYDYGANFTLNFCAPVVEKLDHVVGVDKAMWANISAFYQKGYSTYSLGQLSTEPIFRGRKFVLNYTDGSPCGDDSAARLTDASNEADRHSARIQGGSGSRASSSATTRRKSALISLLCDRDTADSSRPKVGVSFVGWSPDECSYYFEARSQYICGGAAPEPQTVGPGSVLSAIVLITLAVYVLGGVAYQRIVMHQRGWRQLPNYAMWASMASLLWGFVLLVLSCCTRVVPRQRGYNQIPAQSRIRNQDAENRLIDNYDEEWED